MTAEAWPPEDWREQEDERRAEDRRRRRTLKRGPAGTNTWPGKAGGWSDTIHCFSERIGQCPWAVGPRLATVPLRGGGSGSARRDYRPKGVWSAAPMTVDVRMRCVCCALRTDRVVSVRAHLFLGGWNLGPGWLDLCFECRRRVPDLKHVDLRQIQNV